MKVIAAILILVACVLADDEWTIKSSEEMKQIRINCLKEHPLSTEQLTKIKTFEYPNEAEIRQYLLCIADKMGIFSLQQGYYADRIAKQFKIYMKEEEIKKMADDCIANFPKGDKSNDVAVYEVHNCLKNSVVGDKIKSYIKKRYQARQKSTL